MSAIQTSYNCQCCGRKYKRKVYYDRHVAVCQLLVKTKVERETDIELNSDTPSHRELYEMVLGLARQNRILEDKIEELTKWAALKKKRLHVSEWLDSNYQDTIHFDIFMRNQSFEDSDLDGITKFDYIEGVCMVLKRWFPTHLEAELPIKAFDQKDNTFFIKTEKGWRAMTTEELSQIIRKVGKDAMNVFVKWQEQNKHKMETEEYSTMYTTRLMKVLGSNYTDQQVLTRVRRDLFKYLKMNLKNVIQFEFAF